MRIRSTKPEFWRSERVASVSWDARLVLKGLESYVDDNGVGKDDIALIVGDVFPRDMARDPRDTLARVSESISELFQAGLLWRYEGEGSRLLYVSFWEDIQRIDKPGKGRLPRPDGTFAYGESRIRESVANSRESVAPGTGEQGNRGTEEQRNRGTDTPAPSALTNAFETAWPHWPKKVERKPALEKFKVAARKFPDVSELVAAVIRFGDAYAATTETRFVPALGVWLGKERWTDELPQRQQERSNFDGHAELWASYAQPSPQMEIEQ